MKTLFIIFASISMAQELPKVAPKEDISEALKLEFYQASSAEKTAKSQHEELMNQLKTAINESITKQMQSVIRVLIANSKLQEACSSIGKELDQKAIQNDEIKCTEKAKDASK